ncbi:helix-turn-helix domain-containing protein [Sphingomonas baiyangensis]|uniref:ImmA/IrrE family metallo-endopeptidase n=1 Tax=Sphingomonas baiyangensis TaxID=2572576 RepID=A0A4U1L2V6_9SPHN|nr:helix-turn-helix transcriptional regulator [Sphingomonas baiyangensis]TKD51227.1 ImmA/IrrE family metallo-endopeptidase [Sphingomonas baiyangensis]
MPSPRLFAGHQLRALRRRHALTQAAAATRLGISTSYLSQIENGDRPLTGLVQAALARAFPHEWGEIGEDAGLTAAALAAATDPAVDGPAAPDPGLHKALRQQPQLARRLVALHAAYARVEAQVRVLDDRVESGESLRRQPWEAVRDWFHHAGNYIDPLDRAAEALAARFPADATPRRAIAERLQARHRVTIEGGGGQHGRALRLYDPQRRTLTIDRTLPPESALFQLAHQLVRLELEAAIEAIVTQSGLADEAARALLSVGLANYAAGALLMPYAAFRDAARGVRHDIDRLRQQFGVSFEQACHRLSTLQRPGAEGIPFFFCRVDMAGNITKRHSATPLEFARFGGACPLWIVHEAVAIPDRILVQRAETPDGVRYVTMAKGLVKPSGSFARSPRRYAVTIGCETRHAADFVYADELRPDGPATPIGSSCRICPRTACDQRAFPPAASIIEIDPNARAIVPYGFR